MGEMIEYTPISKANSGLIKFDSKKPHILEFDIDDTDRGFTQNMVGGQIVIPNMYAATLITGSKDVTNVIDAGNNSCLHRSNANVLKNAGTIIEWNQHCFNLHHPGCEHNSSFLAKTYALIVFFSAMVISPQ